MSILQYCALILYLGVSCPPLLSQPQTVACMVQTAHNTQIGRDMDNWFYGGGEMEKQRRKEEVELNKFGYRIVSCLLLSGEAFVQLGRQGW